MSNNGCQHLTALTKDEITAPHVNLVPLDLPGDLYSYVAEHVWKKVNKEANTIGRDIVENYVDNLIEMKKQIASTEAHSDARAACVEKIQQYKVENKDLAEISSYVFWARVKDEKSRRKIAKRVETLRL